MPEDTFEAAWRDGEQAWREGLTLEALRAETARRARAYAHAHALRGRQYAVACCDYGFAFYEGALSVAGGMALNRRDGKLAAEVYRYSLRNPIGTLRVEES